MFTQGCVCQSGYGNLRVSVRCVFPVFILSFSAFGASLNDSSESSSPDTDYVKLQAMLGQMQLFGPRITVTESLSVVKSTDDKSLASVAGENAANLKTGSAPVPARERNQLNNNAVLSAGSIREIAAITTTYSSASASASSRTGVPGVDQFPALNKVQPGVSHELIAPVSILGKSFDTKRSTKYRHLKFFQEKVSSHQLYPD